MGLSTAHNAPIDTSEPSLSAAVGGAYAEVSGGRRPGGVVGGGRRGKVTEFSRSSRRNMMRLLNSINRSKVGLPLFVTLTYPGTWPETREERKGHFDAFQKRMERKFGKFPAVWRLEFQRRGAPHYHLLMFSDVFDVVPMRELVAFVSQSWYESCGRICPEHLAAGTQVSRARSWKGVNGYAAKYLAKLESLSVAESPGRFWGVWRKDLLPIAYEDTQLTLSGFFKLRRVFRRYGSLRLRNTREHRRVSCFMSHASSRRLLGWLGIIETGERVSYRDWRRAQDAASAGARLGSEPTTR